MDWLWIYEPQVKVAKFILNQATSFFFLMSEDISGIELVKQCLIMADNITDKQGPNKDFTLD